MSIHSISGQLEDETQRGGRGWEYKPESVPLVSSSDAYHVSQRGFNLTLPKSSLPPMEATLTSDLYYASWRNKSSHALSPLLIPSHNVCAGGAQHLLTFKHFCP